MTCVSSSRPTRCMQFGTLPIGKGQTDDKVRLCRVAIEQSSERGGKRRERTDLPGSGDVINAAGQTITK